MKNQPEFELKVIEALSPLPEGEAGKESAATDFTTTAQEALDALQATKGASEILARFPELQRAAATIEIAYFSECERRGTVRGFQILGADRIRDCRVWFNDVVTPGKEGSIYCFFYAPRGPALYTMTAKFDSGEQAEVECRVDGISFGPLGISGPTTQPHPAQLCRGSHLFQIEQRYGSFQFLSLTVHSELPAGFTIVPPVLYEPRSVAGAHVHQRRLVAEWTGDTASDNTYVVSQSPRAGDVVADGSTVTMGLREGERP